MTQSKRQQERQWKDRKQSQNPHGKVRSLEQLAEDMGKNESETKKNCLRMRGYPKGADPHIIVRSLPWGTLSLSLPKRS